LYPAVKGAAQVDADKHKDVLVGESCPSLWQRTRQLKEKYMRKIIASEMVTLDGYFAGPNGEIDWFFWNEGIAKSAIDLMNNSREK
jgi:hypothetical protein